MTFEEYCVTDQYSISMIKKLFMYSQIRFYAEDILIQFNDNRRKKKKIKEFFYKILVFENPFFQVIAVLN